MANFKFGNCHLEPVHLAADAPAAIAGCQAKQAAFLADADIPAFPRDGALDAPEGKLGCAQNCSRFAKMGAGAPGNFPRIMETEAKNYFTCEHG